MGPPGAIGAKRPLGAGGSAGNANGTGTGDATGGSSSKRGRDDDAVPKTASFDQPMSDISTLENLTRGRTQLPKGRRAPSKPIKVYLLDGHYHGVAITPDLTVSKVIETMLDKLYARECDSGWRKVVGILNAGRAYPHS